MKSRIKRPQRSLYSKRAKELQRALPGIAQRAAQQGEAHALRALNLGVYSTEPGEYVRTGKARESLRFAADVGRAGIDVLAEDTADYASHIEYGSGPYALSEPQLEAYLKAMPAGGLLNFGRSGKAYLLPQPFVSVGLRKAQGVIQQQLRAEIERLWR